MRPKITIECEPYVLPSLAELNDMMDIIKAKIECHEKIRAIKERRK